MKKTILFVVDKPKWAYEYMVISWLPYLLDQYNCYIIYQTDYAIVRSANTNSFYQYAFNLYSELKSIKSKMPKKKIHQDGYFYNSDSSPKLYKFTSKDGEKELIMQPQKHFDYMIEMAFYFQYTSHFPFSANKNVVGIFTDAFPHDGPHLDLKKNIDRKQFNRLEFFKNYLESYDHIIVGGGNLYEDYKAISDKVSFVYGIYGEENFVENKKVGAEETITIGWTGTPDRPMKGFREFIEPAIKKVQDTGRNIKLKTKFSGSYEELYTFYSDVDFIIIASSADSGPSLYAEASLSSVPTLSTKVGLPLMGIEDYRTGIFIERTIDSIYKAIIKLYDDRALLQTFSKNVKADYLNKLGNDKSVQNILKILQ